MNDEVSSVLTSMINLQKFLQTLVKWDIQRKYCVIRAQCYCQIGFICLLIRPTKAAGVPGVLHELGAQSVSGRAPAKPWGQVPEWGVQEGGCDLCWSWESCTGRCACQGQLPALAPDMMAWQSFDVEIKVPELSFRAAHKELLMVRLVKMINSFWLWFIALLLKHQVVADAKSEGCFCGAGCFLWWSKSSLCRTPFSECL